MSTPADVVAALRGEGASRPRLTWYDDAAGERLDFSGTAIGRWIAKAGNALQEEFDAQPGTVVRIDLPCPHWRAVYWAMATWAVGATLAVDDSEGADVLITTDPFGELAQDADEVVAVSLPALAGEWAGDDLPTGVVDEAAQLGAHGDDLDPWHTPDADDDALAAGGERLSYGELLDPLALPHPGERVLIISPDLRTVLREVLGTWAAGGSVVLAAGGSADDPRWVDEGVTRHA